MKKTLLAITLALIALAALSSQGFGFTSTPHSFYGMWKVKGDNSSAVLFIDFSQINSMTSDGDYFVIADCAWTTAVNIYLNDPAEYRGFKVSGTVSAISERWGKWVKSYMPVYLFLHVSDPDKMYIYFTPNDDSERQDLCWGPFERVK